MNSGVRATLPVGSGNVAARDCTAIGAAAFDAHDAGRQAANIAHEIAHAILHHPVPELFGANGKRNHDKAHEDEANWLGPALLISDEAAVSIVTHGMSIGEAAELYGTSHEVVRMRINVSGTRKRVMA